LSWLDVNWKHERPSKASVELLWRSFEVTTVTEVLPAVEEYLVELRRVYTNGGAYCARFHVNGNEDFNWFATRNRWDEMSFFSRLLLHPALVSALPQVAAEGRATELAEFSWGSSLTLDGELARALVLGGAYEQFKGTSREAKELGARVAESVFGDRFLDVVVFRCWKPWSPWFFDVAWDSTMLLIDRRLQLVTVLVSTDTD